MNNSDDVIYVDVDFTLLVPTDVDLLIPDSVNKKLIDQIKEWHKNGRTIIVWTSNPKGVEHCKTAAKLCGIEDCVYDYLPKPRTIVDDDHLEYYKIIDPLTLEVNNDPRNR